MIFNPFLLLYGTLVASQIMTYEIFKDQFNKEIFSEKKNYYFIGLFLIVIGPSIIIFFEIGIINYSGTKGFHYVVFLLVSLMGVWTIYWIRIRYRISVYRKDYSDAQMERRVEEMREKYGMDILKKQDTCYSFFYKPGFWTPWTEVNLFYDKEYIYINARPITRGIVDFGFAKRLENKIINEIKTSH